MCFRNSEPTPREPTAMSRELWAEEAGRAAAVSYAALAQSEAFRTLSGARNRSNGERWQLLYEAASNIGVNRSALVTQLELEGRIVVQKENRRQILHIQPALTGALD